MATDNRAERLRIAANSPNSDVREEPTTRAPIRFQTDLPDGPYIIGKDGRPIPIRTSPDLTLHKPPAMPDLLLEMEEEQKGTIEGGHEQSAPPTQGSTLPEDMDRRQPQQEQEEIKTDDTDKQQEKTMATPGPEDISAPLITHSALPNPQEDSGVQPIRARQLRLSRGVQLSNCAGLLQSERKRKGWTQEQLANKMSVPVSEVRRWENTASPSYPGKDVRRKLADLLGKDIYHTLDEALGAQVGNQGVQSPPLPTPPTAPTNVRNAQQSVEIFCCYARKDQKLLNKLKTHLKPLERQELITLWADTDIGAGTEWENEINEHLNTAQIILLLVSPDFMASDYCYSKEMMRALERHERREACVIPVILRRTYWQEAPFSKLEVLPKGADPVKSWPSLDDALNNVAVGIRKAVERLRK